MSRYVLERTKRAVRWITTLDPRKLTAKDYIDRMAVNLPVELMMSRRPVTEPRMRCEHFNFQYAHCYTLPGPARLSGFFHYHVPYASQLLSGGLRFRCVKTPDPSAFEAGHDLLDRFGLPWHISLARMIARVRFTPYFDQVVHDGLLTELQLRKARRLLMYNPEREKNGSPNQPHLVYAVDQPFAIDFIAPLQVVVPGPHSMLRTTLLPALMAKRGSAVVRFERIGDPDNEAVVLRILKSQVPHILDHEDNLPQFSNLPPLHPGSLVPDPKRGGTWVWKYTDTTFNLTDAAPI
ncbi:hypothetical protein C8R47DRAFT_1101595 [Mycena vitilis]|nr:hypothetical protein C8R47DRAFT_1101595 [Mycena vitilis]